MHIKNIESNVPSSKKEKKVTRKDKKPNTVIVSLKKSPKEKNVNMSPKFLDEVISSPEPTNNQKKPIKKIKSKNIPKMFDKFDTSMIMLNSISLSCILEKAPLFKIMFHEKNYCNFLETFFDCLPKLEKRKEMVIEHPFFFNNLFQIIY